MRWATVFVLLLLACEPTLGQVGALKGQGKGAAQGLVMVGAGFTPGPASGYNSLLYSCFAYSQQGWRVSITHQDSVSTLLEAGELPAEQSIALRRSWAAAGCNAAHTHTMVKYTIDTATDSLSSCAAMCTNPPGTLYPCVAFSAPHPAVGDQTVNTTLANGNFSLAGLAPAALTCVLYIRGTMDTLGQNQQGYNYVIERSFVSAETCAASKRPVWGTANRRGVKVLIDPGMVESLKLETIRLNDLKYKYGLVDVDVVAANSSATMLVSNTGVNTMVHMAAAELAASHGASGGALRPRPDATHMYTTERCVYSPSSPGSMYQRYRCIGGKPVLQFFNVSAYEQVSLDADGCPRVTSELRFLDTVRPACDALDAQRTSLPSGDPLHVHAQCLTTVDTMNEMDSTGVYIGYYQDTDCSEYLVGKDTQPMNTTQSGQCTVHNTVKDISPALLREMTRRREVSINAAKFLSPPIPAAADSSVVSATPGGEVPDTVANPTPAPTCIAKNYTEWEALGCAVTAPAGTTAASLGTVRLSDAQIASGYRGTCNVTCSRDPSAPETSLPFTVQLTECKSNMWCGYDYEVWGSRTSTIYGTLPTTCTQSPTCSKAECCVPKPCPAGSTGVIPGTTGTGGRSGCTVSAGYTGEVINTGTSAVINNITLNAPAAVSHQQSTNLLQTDAQTTLSRGSHTIKCVGVNYVQLRDFTDSSCTSPTNELSLGIQPNASVRVGACMRVSNPGSLTHSKIRSFRIISSECGAAVPQPLPVVEPDGCEGVTLPLLGCVHTRSVGVLAIVLTLLLCFGIIKVMTASDPPHVPGPALVKEKMENAEAGRVEEAAVEAEEKVAEEV